MAIFLWCTTKLYKSFFFYFSIFSIVCLFFQGGLMTKYVSSPLFLSTLIALSFPFMLTYSLPAAVGATLYSFSCNQIVEQGVFLPFLTTPLFRKKLLRHIRLFLLGVASIYAAALFFVVPWAYNATKQWLIIAQSNSLFSLGTQNFHALNKNVSISFEDKRNFKGDRELLSVCIYAPFKKQELFFYAPVMKLKEEGYLFPSILGGGDKICIKAEQVAVCPLSYFKINEKIIGPPRRYLLVADLLRKKDIAEALRRGCSLALLFLWGEMAFLFPLILWNYSLPFRHGFGIIGLSFLLFSFYVTSLPFTSFPYHATTIFFITFLFFLAMRIKGKKI